jgi:hypothetical protein
LLPLSSRSRLLLFVAGGLLLPGCRSTPLAFGTTPSVVRRGADLLFGGFAARFSGIERTPKSAEARRRLIRAALVPSRVFDDTAVWTARAGDSRSLLVAGRATDRGYYFAENAAASRPIASGDSWHIMALSRLGPELFRWNTAVDFSVGELGAAQVADLFGRFVGAAEGREPAQVRADYRAAFPRTTAAFGQLASVDSLRLSNLPDGSTTHSVVVKLDPARLARRYPRLAAYVRKYVSTGKARLVLRDPAGASWLVADARDERIRFTLRSRDGRLAPLSGPARALPDSLVLEADMTVRVKLFTVGFSHLVTDLIVDRTEQSRSWTVRARREPEWHLPLIAERLLRTALRRPFQGRGAMFKLGVRDERGVTLLVRSTELTVEESAILRFLNSLSGAMLDDFDPRTEREQNLFLREVFLAMRADVHALTE